MADRKKHVLSKVVKNTIFQNKTLLVMFYRHNKIFWYQVCNFKHILKAENSEDSLASSCEEFCISFHVTQYGTGLLLELAYGVHGVHRSICLRSLSKSTTVICKKYGSCREMEYAV